MYKANISLLMLASKKEGGYLVKKNPRKDISERKQAEEVLRESEEKYRTQFDAALDAILIADAKTGILVDCNRAACELVERKKSELVGKHQRILHPPSDIKGEFSRTFKQHLKEKEGQVLEARVITKKGKIIPVAIRATIFKIKGKKFLQGIFRDITEQKQAEQAVLRTNMFNSALVENAPFGIMTINPNGSVEYVNPAMLEVSGNPKKAFKRMNIFKLPSYTQISLSEKIRACFRGQSFFLGPVDYVSHFSHKRTVRNFTGMPMRDEAGRIEKVMLFIEDITKMREAEEEMKRRTEELEKFNKLSVGRELKMVELKKRITELEAKLNKQIK